MSRASPQISEATYTGILPIRCTGTNDLKWQEDIPEKGICAEEVSLGIINALTMSGSNKHQTNKPFKLVPCNLVLGGVRKMA